MLNKTALFLLVVTVALLASPGLARPVAAQDLIVVDDNGPPSCAPVLPSNIYTTITAALAAPNLGDAIHVCDGVYNEQPLITRDNLTITGPGATDIDDGVATVRHTGGNSAVFIIQGDGVILQGLDIDATKPGGYMGDTTGIESSGARVSIERNEIRNATSTAVSAAGTCANVHVINNNIHDTQAAVITYCDDPIVAGNTINATDRALEMSGSRGNFTNNTVAHGRVSVWGDDSFIANNQISGPSPATYLMLVNGSFVSVTDNNFHDSGGYGLQVEPGPSGTSVTIVRNTFARLENGINLYDSAPGDGAIITATIGGNQADANTFVDSAGSLGDFNYLLRLDGVALPIDAQYNDWGLCTTDEIEQEVWHQVDDPTQGLVDFEPFIAPSGCSSTPTPTPTATPTPTPTPGPTSTPTPGATRTVTIPPGSWANFAWTGDSSPQTVADCFGADNVVVMYRLDAATGSFQRWVRGREDLSNMTDVSRYDVLLALNGSGLPATCTMPDQLSSYTVTIPAGRWANLPWLNSVGSPAGTVAQACGEGNIAVMYRLDAATQTFQRWVRGREDLSNMTDVQPYDVLLALNGSGQPATCQISGV